MDMTDNFNQIILTALIIVICQQNVPFKIFISIQINQPHSISYDSMLLQTYLIHFGMCQINKMG